MKLLTTLGIVLALSLCWNVVRAEDNKDYTRYNAWSGVEDGSSITMSMESMGNVTVIKTSLVKKTDTNITLKTEMSLQGTVLSTTEKVEPIKPDFLDGEMTGTETITVSDKDYECEVWELKQTTKAGEKVVRVWLHDALATALKMETSGPVMKSVLVATKVGEKMKVGDIEYSCVVLEGETKSASSTGTQKLWMCSKIPGGMVKMESAIQMGGKEYTTVNTVTEVDIK